MDTTLRKSVHHSAHHNAHHNENATTSNKFLQRYWDFCDGQKKYSMAWFFFPAIILPCLFMPLAVYFIFTYEVAGLLPFLFVSAMFFLGGMIANVGESSTRVTISIFLLAVIWNIAFPAISILLL
jgi:hypothetical protein